MVKNQVTGYGVGAATIPLAPVPLINQNRAPVSTDTNYPVGQIWIYNGEAYILTGVTAGVAFWQEAAGTGGYSITPYVVGPVEKAGYQTIQSAINAVQANGNVGQIWIYPGTYTENLVFPNGFTGSLITGSDESAGSVTIVGTHTPGLTGSIVTWRVALTAGGSGHIFSSNAAGACNIICVHNNFILNGYIFNLPNWTAAAGLNIGYMADRNSTASGVINNTGGAFFGSFDNSLGVGTTFPAIISGPTLIQSNNWGCPFQTQGSAVLNVYDSNFNDQMVLGGSTSGSITRTKHITGANPAVTYSSSGNTLFTQSTITSTNNPAIAGSGAGTLTIGDLTFTSNSSLAGTLTVSYASSILGSSSINGNLTLNQAGNKLNYTSLATTTTAGANSAGTVTLAGGTATVSTTAVTASSKIRLTRQSIGATGAAALGVLSVGTITAGTSFVINAVQPASATSLQATDVSVVFWEIVN